MKIDGKHVVVTGGASGLGLELVRQLSENNKVSVIARPSSGLENLRREFDQLTIYEADLADMRSVELAADQLVKGDKKIDVLINNAAVQHFPTFLDSDFRYETIKREINVNFTAICTLIYLLMPSLLKSSPSLILNVNSGLALVPKTSSAVYCATKGALNIFSQSLQLQLEDTNIEVQQAFLPLVDTAMAKGRSNAKLPADKVAASIITGMEKSSSAINIGKVKLLRFLLRLSPGLAQSIMKAG